MKGTKRKGVEKKKLLRLPPLCQKPLILNYITSKVLIFKNK